MNEGVRDGVCDCLVKAGFKIKCVGGSFSIVQIKTRRSISQWLSLHYPYCEYTIVVRNDGYVNAYNCICGICISIPLSDPDAIDQLVEALRSNAVPHDTTKLYCLLENSRIILAFETHNSRCNCSYCERRIWPILWIPPISNRPAIVRLWHALRYGGGWIVIAAWFMRRYYLRIYRKKEHKDWVK